MSKAPETWTLPEPARSIWKAHRDTIKRVVQILDPQAQLMLGGGTLLAAQWNHRRSTDIDIAVPGFKKLRETHRNQPYDLEALTGGAFGDQRRERTEIRLLTGKIDLVNYTPRPHGLEHRKTIVDQVEVIQSNTQILRGKLERTRRHPTARDAYDMRVSMELDPMAMARAINAIEVQHVTDAQTKLEDYEPALERGAGKILDVPEQFKKLKYELSTGARRALEDSIYTGIRIDVDDTQTRVILATRRGIIHDGLFINKPPDALLRETALDVHFATNDKWSSSPKEIMDTIQEAQSKRLRRTIIRVGSLYQLPDRLKGTRSHTAGAAPKRPGPKPTRRPQGTSKPARGR